MTGQTIEEWLNSFPCEVCGKPAVNVIRGFDEVPGPGPAFYFKARREYHAFCAEHNRRIKHAVRANGSPTKE